MRLRRRGASFRASSPLVILLIGIVLILYILFLPPAQREALLSGTPSTGGTGVAVPAGGAPVSGGTVLMDKYVGTLLSQSGTDVEHAIPSTTVTVSQNTQEIKFIDSLIVKRGAFASQDAHLSFKADPSVAKNYVLAFNVEEAKGPLLVTLNGQPIYDRVVTTRSPDPIKLPQELLKPENNITFSAGSTGWAFWSANAYRLSNILVSADVTSYDQSSSEQHFTIPPDEYQRMEQARLELVPQCDPKQTGRLSITVNGQLLFGGLIDCGVLSTQDVAKDLLNAGDNRIGFTSSQGSYVLDRIKVVSMLKQQDYPVYYFNLPPDMFQQANVFAGRVVLTLRFSDGNTQKRGSVVVNGFRDTFQTSSYYYQATLDPNVLIPNANSIQIIPEGGSLNVAELRVELLG